MRQTIAFTMLCALFLSGCASGPLAPDAAELRRQVTDTERAFARTMAMRDHAAFTAFLAEDSVFFSGPTPLRGKRQVSDWWKRFYEKAVAPFSWEPEQVEVLDSGTLALSSGPVRNPQGKLISTYTSIWRMEAPGVWRIIFDKGNEVCDCQK
ncbi:MAG: nuclear transport factor 2 family protein [Sterolibacterium sp.]|jgi:ketosteroid isomerase-like protein